MRHPALALLFLSGAALASSAAPAGGFAPEEPLLTPGVEIDGTLGAGEGRRYRLVLKAGDYLALNVDQRGLDVALALASPTGRVLATIDSPNDRWGPEPLAFVAREAGAHRIEVRAAPGGARGSSYRLRAELRPATAKDRRAARADADLREATRLIVQASPSSLRAALELTGSALRELQALGDAAGRARALHLSAFAQRQLGDARRAAGLEQQSLELRERAGDAHGRAESLNHLGLAQFALGDAGSATQRFEQAALACREQAQVDCEASALSNLALAAQAGGRLSEALEHYRRAFGLMATVDHPDQTIVLSNLCGLHHQLGDPEEASRCFELLLPLLRAGGRRRVEADALNSLARVRLQLGQPQQAHELFRQALELARAVGYRSGEAVIEANLGELHAHLGAHETALSYYQTSLGLWRELGDRRQEGRVLTLRGRALLELGRPREAQAPLAQAAELWLSVDDRHGRAATLCEIADVALALGDAERAQGALASALDLFRQAGDPPGQAFVLDRMGEAQHKRGEAEQAYESFRAALELRTRMGDRLGAGGTLTGLGLAAADLGRFDEARVNLEAALEALEALRGATWRPDLRVSLLASNRAAYERLIDVRMRLHAEAPDGSHAAAAFEASERYRARSLLDSLATSTEGGLSQDLTPELARRLHTVETRIQALADTLDPTYRGPRPEAERLRSLDALLRERRDLTARVREQSPRYAALNQPPAASLAEIQRDLIDADTLLLEYVLLPGRSYLWALDADGLRSFELPGRERIEVAAAQLRERWAAPDAAASWSTAAQQLAQLVLGPIAPLLGRKRLAVVADGALQSLPFGALPEPGTRTPLIVRHELVSLPSASVVRALRRDLADRPRPERLMAVFADPVFDASDSRVRPMEGTAGGGGSPEPSGSSTSEARPRFYRLRSARREAETILALDPSGRSLAALDFEATRQRATAPDLASYRFVHFATHGWLDTRRPELSGIVLSLVDPRGAPLDGFLRLNQIVDLRLGADLVVLSACETALGQQVQGEGLVGLARGFMHAGAPRVVASLWQVPDQATTEVMRLFYRAMLSERKAPAAALRQAQLAVRAQRNWRDPYYWAGFVLQGEWQ